MCGGMIRYFSVTLVCLLLVLCGPVAELYAYRVDLGDARIGQGLRIKELHIELGNLAGKLCNDTDALINEVSFLVRTYDHERREVGRRVIDVYGVSAKNCRPFDARGHIDDYLDAESWDALPVFFNRKPIAPYNNVNSDEVIDRLQLSNNVLSGRLCNNGRRDLHDLFLSVLAQKFNQGLVLNERRYVGEVKADECVEFTYHLAVQTPLPFRQEFLFELTEIADKGENGNGEIVPGLAYEGLNYYRGKLTATLINRSEKAQQNVFVKFYGMSPGEGVIVAQGFYLERLDPGGSLPIKKTLYVNKNVAHWRFSVVGWE